MSLITEQIQTHILSGCTGKDIRALGAELETIIYTGNGQRIPVNPGKEFSATDFIQEMDTECKKEKTFTTCSLEPGGQVEWASKPAFSIHDIADEFQKLQKVQKRVCKNHNLKMVDLSLEPLYTPRIIDLIRQSKYELMNDTFLKTGQHGQWMMRNTTSVQINIDISSKNDAEEMAYLSDIFQPFSILLFANSPFMNGELTHTENVRYKIWSDTDPARCGSLLDHDILRPNGLLEKYSQWIQQIPAIFIYNNERLAVPFAGTLGAYLQSLEQIEKEHVVSALHQVFTHVRLKHVLEVRSPDRPPEGYEMAPIAFWAGLLTGKNTREKFIELAARFTLDDRKLLNEQANYLDLNQQGPKNKTLKQWMEIVCELVLEGLDERSSILGKDNEKIYLEPYLESFFSNGFMSLQIQNEYKQSGASLKNYILGRNE